MLKHFKIYFYLQIFVTQNPSQSFKAKNSKILVERPREGSHWIVAVGRMAFRRCPVYGCWEKFQRLLSERFMCLAWAIPLD